MSKSLSHCDRLASTAHSLLPLGQSETEILLPLARYASQNFTAGAKPLRGRNSTYGDFEHTDGENVRVLSDIMCML